MHLVLTIKILQILSTKPAQHRQYSHYATEWITEELWFISLQGLFNQQLLKQIILARKTWMQTWMPELRVHSFHPQNTFRWQVLKRKCSFQMTKFVSPLARKCSISSR